MATTKQHWRVIFSGSCDPYFNMGLDEALLLTRQSPPTLRLYQWRSPCLSLGYFQASSDFDPDFLKTKGFRLTRRITGGGAIAHRHEITYSITCNEDHPAIMKDITKSYFEFHTPIIRALQEFGLNVDSGEQAETDASSGRDAYCFKRRAGFDLTVDGRKVGGSAQRRTQRRFLQHGSIILQPSGLPDGAAALDEFARKPLDDDDIMAGVAAAFCDYFDINSSHEQPSAREYSLAEELAHSKYAAGEWINKR
ncbi:biotin/lipoate A/B protein ligase family protein [Planctomycetota bacterium]